VKLSLVASLVSLVSLGGAARGENVPGTGDDPMLELGLSTALVDAPLLDGIAMRGGTAADTRVLLDGFEIPYLWHGGHLRSVVAPQISDATAITDGTDLAFGRAASFVNIRTDVEPRDSLEVGASLLDGSVAGQARLFKTGYRGAAVFRHSLVEGISDATYFDVLDRTVVQLSDRWSLELSGIGARDDQRAGDQPGHAIPREFAGRLEFWRLALAARYRTKSFNVWFAVSHLASSRDVVRGPQHLHEYNRSADTRMIAERSWDKALGLSDVVWPVGTETNATHHDLDIAMPREARDGSPQSPLPATTDTTTRFGGTFWTPDAAMYTSLAASLSRELRATGGVRVDRFGRGNDVATQPRGALDLTLTKRIVARLAAGAFRRPPQHGEELLYSELHPERTTQLTTTLHYNFDPVTFAEATAYYIDRTHLIVRDRATDALVNTGRGTSYGVEVMANATFGKWFAAGSASLSKSTRVDYERAGERRADLDQPFRFDATSGYRAGHWQVAARVQLFSGLPVTPIAAAVYNVDNDHYDPLFGRINSDRLPFHHQVDLRVDRVFRIRGDVTLAVVLDIANAYVTSTPIAYHYSYDYRERLDVTLPIVPYLGLVLGDAR
jgi:hypothetical protein